MRKQIQLGKLENPLFTAVLMGFEMYDGFHDAIMSALKVDGSP